MMKQLDKDSLRRMGFISSHSSRKQLIPVGGMQGSWSLPAVSTVGKQREVNAGAQHTLSFSFHLGSKPMGEAVQVGFPSVKPLWNHVHPQKCFLGDSKTS